MGGRHVLVLPREGRTRFCLSAGREWLGGGVAGNGRKSADHSGAVQPSVDEDRYTDIVRLG